MPLEMSLTYPARSLGCCRIRNKRLFNHMRGLVDLCAQPKYVVHLKYALYTIVCAIYAVVNVLSRLRNQSRRYRSGVHSLRRLEDYRFHDFLSISISKMALFLAFLSFSKCSIACFRSFPVYLMLCVNSSCPSVKLTS